MNNNRMMKAAVWLIVLFLLAFTVYQGYNYIYGGYTTEDAYSYVVSSSFLTRGVLLRNEEPLTLAPSGVVVYRAAEGSKFRSGTVLAYSYASQSDADADLQAREADAELERLSGIRDAVNAQTVRDVEQLGESIDYTLRSLTYDAARGEYDTLSDERLDLVEALNRRSLLTGDGAALDARIAELETLAAAEPRGTAVAANTAGYFSRYVDGQESAFGFDLLDTADASSIDALAAQDYPYDAAAFGKAVKDYRWYYVTTVSAQDAESFIVGRRVTLRFVGSSGASLSGSIVTVKSDEASGRTMVAILGEAMNSDTISRRVASVEVSFAAVSGVRFPAEALRIIDGVRGVFIDAGYTVQFKKVDILYTGSDFYISRQYSSDADSETYLSIFDRIIVEGKDLYDGKPLV